MSAVRDLLLNARSAGPDVTPVDAVMGEDWAALNLGRPRTALRLAYLQGRHGWSRGQGRARISAGVVQPAPHAMVKLIGSGGTSNAAGLRAQIDYLSRGGDVPLHASEANFGVAIEGADVAELVRAWGLPERQVEGAARTSHFVVSFPAGTSEAAAERAGRAWAARLFESGDYGDRWDYYTAFHTDTAFPHMHVVVNRRGLEAGRWLKVSARSEITFEELRVVQVGVAARENITLVATPRLARGVHDRPVPDAEYRRARREGRAPSAPEHTPETAVLSAAHVVGFSRQYEGDAAILREEHPELAARLDAAAATLMAGLQIEAVWADARKREAGTDRQERSARPAADPKEIARQHGNDAATPRKVYSGLAARAAATAAALKSASRNRAGRVDAQETVSRLNKQELSIMAETIEEKRGTVAAGFTGLDEHVRKIPDPKTRAEFIAQLARIKSGAAPFLRDYEQLQAYRPDQASDRYRNPAVPGEDMRMRAVRDEADRRVADLAREAGLDPDAAVQRHREPTVSRGLARDFGEEEFLERAGTLREGGKPPEIRSAAEAALTGYHRRAASVYLEAASEISKLQRDPARVYQASNVTPLMDREGERERERIRENDPHDHDRTRGRGRKRQEGVVNRTGPEDIPFFAALGLLLGIIPGLLVAGGWLTWVRGGDLTQIDLLTIWHARTAWSGQWGGVYETALTAGLGVTVAFVVLGAALGCKPRLTQHGSAHWAPLRRLRRAGLVADRVDHIRGPVWGKFGRPEQRAGYLSSNDIVHSMVIAPTGAGKGVGVVIPTLLTYSGSIVCLDVKGENFGKTSRRRREFGDRVYHFSPYDPRGRTHCFNPVDEVASAPERHRYTEALRLAGSLVAATGDTQSWIGGCREIVAATIVHAIQKGTPTIAAVYDLLSQKGSQGSILKNLGDETIAQDARSVFHRYGAMPSDTLGGYISILFGGGLRLWADPLVRDATSRTDFHVRDFRRDPASVYICVGQKDLEILSPVIRLLFTQMFTWLQENDPEEDDKLPVLFLLDEFASLGTMDEMSRAITTVRSSGAHLMIIVQSMANLRLNYGADGTANFLGNCDLQLFMAPTDLDTPEYVTKAIGDFTRTSRTKSWRQASWSSVAFQERFEGAKLIRSEEIRMLGEDRAIALVRDSGPVLMNRIIYYKDRSLKKIFDRQKRVGDIPIPEPLAERVAIDAARVEADPAQQSVPSTGPDTGLAAASTLKASGATPMGQGGDGREVASPKIPTAPESTGPSENAPPGTADQSSGADPVPAASTTPHDGSEPPRTDVRETGKALDNIVESQDTVRTAVDGVLERLSRCDDPEQEKS